MGGLRNVLILLVVFLWGGGLSPPAAMAQVYPSTATGWVLPGEWQTPSAPAMFNTPDDVKQWEAAHADIIFGSLQDVDQNTKTVALGYMYSQKWDCRPGRQEAWMHQQAMQQGLDPENMYVHYGEDTVLKVPEINTGMADILNGQPYHLLFVRDGNFSTAHLPIRFTPADTLFVISAYPTQEIIIDAHVAPTVALSQPNTMGEIGQWRSVNMTWLPVNATSHSPSAGSIWQGTRLDQITWQPALARNQGRMLNSGLKALDEGLPVWVMALSWPVDSTVHSVTFQPWVTTKGDTMHFPGWDDRNDPDGDGWVNNQEWGARANTVASARFRHQARVIPAAHMWPNTCWYRTNFTDPAINTLHAHWYRHDWQQQGLSGAYNDDMAKLLGENQFSLLSGGTLIEIAHPVGHHHTSMIYAQQMARFLRLVKTTTKTQWLAANISELNLWEYAAWPVAFRNVMDVWLREHYLSPAVGLARLQRKWDSFALAKRDDKSLIMVTTKGGRSSQIPLCPEAWNQDIATGLALYYLFNIPGQTYYHSWNQTFYYGSSNTDVNKENPTNSTWYRGGVPKNWAYQPSAMLRVAIGNPVNAPAGYPLVYWQSKTDEVPSSHHMIKTHQTERVPLNPANWFWLYRSGWWGEFPDEGVIARQYSEGLVVYRATRTHDDPHFFHATPLRVSLPGEYQRVNIDGSLSQPLRYIELKGYEGVVLKRYPSR